MYKEERDVLEGEMRKIDEYDMERFSALDQCQKNDRYPGR